MTTARIARADFTSAPDCRRLRDTGRSQTAAPCYGTGCMGTPFGTTLSRLPPERRMLASAVGGVVVYLAIAAAYGVRLGASAHASMAISCLLLIAAALHVPPAERREVRQRAIGTGLLLSGLTVVLLVTWGLVSLKRSVLLDYVPEALQVGRVLYEKEERWGLPLLALPGDNETGLRVYVLPDAPAVELERGGVDWLEALPQRARASSSRHRGVYSDWRRTPLDRAARRHVTRVDTDGVGDCGFCLRVDVATWAQAEDILERPGSFYAVGRSGVIVVSPRHRRVLYMFSG